MSLFLFIKEKGFGFSPYGEEEGIRTFCIDKKYQKATRGGQLWRLRPGRCPLAAPPLTNFYASKTAGSARTAPLWLIWRQYTRRRLSMGGHGGPRPKRSESPVGAGVRAGRLRRPSEFISRGPRCNPAKRLLWGAPRADFWFFCSVTKEHQRPPLPRTGALI